MRLNLGAISRLPQLQRLAYLPHYIWGEEETQILSSCLEDTEMFPLLNIIAYGKLIVGNEFKEICRRRNIQLASHYKGRSSCFRLSSVFSAP